MVILIIIMVAIAWWELPGLINNRQFKELAVFSGLWFLAAVYSALNILGIEVNPVKAIVGIIEYFL